MRIQANAAKLRVQMMQMPLLHGHDGSDIAAAPRCSGFCTRPFKNSSAAKA